MESNKACHERLTSLLFKHGERFQKKHGNWIRLSFDSSSHFIMDSWNKNIKVVYGECNYDNQHTGFDNYKTVASLGVNFGGFELKVSDSIMCAWLEKAEFIIKQAQGE